MRRGPTVVAWLFAACLPVVGCSTPRDEEGVATTTTTTTTATTTSSTVMATRPATEPLELLLLWLLSPTGTCSPSNPELLLDPSEDPMVALLQALGFAPNSRSACPSEPADP